MSAPAPLPGPAELRGRLEGIRIAERTWLGRELERLERRPAGARRDAALRALAGRMAAAVHRVERLRALPLRVALDPTLPISAHGEEIRRALEVHRVVVVCGATGSGKSTQLPKLCLAAGRGALGLIGHTQPRRIAARALAGRIAEELGTVVGAAVGFQVRFAERLGPDCRVKLMTDGILLKELASDPALARYDTLIIDEAHERSLSIDLLLGVLRGLAARRADLRIIIASATLDAGRLADFFGGAPVIEVSGRSFPVEVRYRPLALEDEDAAEPSLPEAVLAAVRELDNDPRTAAADVLVFLPGEQHIRESAEALASARLAATEVLPLYAALSPAEQERIFARHSQRRIVLATNVAETSLTVPGIRAVVDSGLARISRYSVRGKVQRLPIEPVSRASAEQRRGRCGREAEGICIRLYSQADFDSREAFTPPEILRTNLASVLLQMAALGLGTPESFAFLDPPDVRLVNDGVRLLQELRAMDEERRVTRIGERLAALPCDPRLGRMLLAASERHCLSELTVISAFLAAQDPRERSSREAEARHLALADPRSDFMSVLSLWRAWRARAQRLPRTELRRWCREHFRSFTRLREWQDLHEQLAEVTAELGLVANAAPAGYADIHRAILAGALGGIGLLDERREYQGVRGTRFVIAPGSPLAVRPPRWVVAASLVETTRLYARMVAAVQPAWIESAGAHLVRRGYADAHWDRARGQVMAYESVTLYGLTLVPRRRVSYGPIAHAESRDIFIREALVAADAAIGGEFLSHNRALRTAIERLEAKIRRRDILIEEAEQVAFYRARIPEQVSSLGAFESWRRETERHTPELLCMSARDLMRREAPEAGPDRFPDVLEVHGSALPLGYVFEPGAADDGITLTVPEVLLDELDPDQLAWLVPGLEAEKLAAILRALPKRLRKQLVPLPEHTRAALAALTGGTAALAAPAGAVRPGLYMGLAQWLTERTGEPVSPAELAALPIPAHLRLNLRIIAPEKDSEQAPARVLAQGRDLTLLRQRLRTARAHEGTAPAPAAKLHRTWDFGDVPETRSVERAAVRYIVHPALEDRGIGVACIEAASAAQALALTRAGIARLAVLALPAQARQLRVQYAADRELVLLSQGSPLERPLPEALVDRAFAEAFVPQEQSLPRSAAEFHARLQARRGELSACAESLAALLRVILARWRSVRAALAAARRLAGERTDAFSAALADIDAQLEALLPPDFLASIPDPWLRQLPRYLQAIARRLERLPGNVRRDAELAAQVRPFAAAWQRLAAGGGLARSPSLTQFRWLIEEFRVSLYAQELKTLTPVSPQRLSAELARSGLAASLTLGA